MRNLLLFLFSHRFLAIARWEGHFLFQRLLNALSGQDRHASRFLAEQPRARFLNLGSGPKGRNDGQWVNVDGFKDRNVHFLLDISRRLPFPEGTFKGAFCEHVLEHFSLEDGERVAAEVRRILAPGATLRLIVPDAEKVVRLYVESPHDLINYRGEGGTAMEAVNSFFRQRYEHQFLYDWQTLEKMLKRAGFTQVQRVEFGKGRAHEIIIDDQKYAWESLYVDRSCDVVRAHERIVA
jgi:predicted SAM-dependent methyltransferase